MAYTETRNINGRKYYYRVISQRNGKKVSKKRIYLGINLKKSEILEKEKTADEKLRSPKKIKTTNKIEDIKSKIERILKKNRVTKAGIFGSYSRGDQKKNSDIDIAVEINNPNMSLIDFIRLNSLLEEALKKKVDLVEYNSIRERIKEKVLNEEIRII